MQETEILAKCGCAGELQFYIESIIDIKKGLSMINGVEVKITIAKLIELAYSKDKGVTTKIVKSRGNLKLTVDQNGTATLSGSAGILTFEGDTALSTLGAKIKNVSISFSHGEGNSVNYVAMYSFSDAANVSIIGSFDILESTDFKRVYS